MFMFARMVNLVELLPREVRELSDMVVYQAIIVRFGDEFVDVSTIEEPELEAESFAEVRGLCGEAIFKIDSF
ncbi:hypothetical protein D3C85_1580020 [compost metagenome]